MTFHWTVKVKDFADGWWVSLKTPDIFGAIDRYDFWKQQGHAVQIESRQGFKDRIDYESTSRLRVLRCSQRSVS